MKNFYNWAVGFFVFFFVIYLFGGLLNFNGWENFDGRFVTAVLFGLAVAALPALLGFFKIKENNGALLLGGLVLNFFFYFLGYYALKLFTLAETGRVYFFHANVYVTIEDKVFGLILISLVSSAITVSLQAISKKAK